MFVTENVLLIMANSPQLFFEKSLDRGRARKTPANSTARSSLIEIREMEVADCDFQMASKSQIVTLNDDHKILRSQFVTSKKSESLRSQIVTSKKETRGGRQYLPFAFTEQGIAMLASVLHSDTAITATIYTYDKSKVFEVDLATYNAQYADCPLKVLPS